MSPHGVHHTKEILISLFLEPCQGAISKFRNISTLQMKCSGFSPHFSSGSSSQGEVSESFPFALIAPCRSHSELLNQQNALLESLTLYPSMHLPVSMAAQGKALSSWDHEQLTAHSSDSLGSARKQRGCQHFADFLFVPPLILAGSLVDWC